MVTFKNLLKLADRIKNKSLRDKTLELLKSPELTHKDVGKAYPTVKFREAPASIGFHHTQTGGLVQHTYAVTLMCISVAESLEKAYESKLDMDSLVAGALLHDIGKLWTYRKKAGAWEANESTMEHVMLGTSELYARGFPEKVMHIIASSHCEPDGIIPPQTLEALILHTVDDLDATIGKSKEESVIRLLLG